MKLALSYSAFDGIELLKYSILSIQNHVDYINVVYQTKSYYGQDIREVDKRRLKTLRKEGFVDKLIKINPKDTGNVNAAKGHEKKKRMAGIEDCLENGCTHFVSMDVDEFYRTREFEWAKRQVKNRALPLTACKIKNYWNLPIYQKEGFSEGGRFHVPFICEINRDTHIGGNFFCKVDPTRKVKNGKEDGAHAFSPKDVHMHHMKNVRENLLWKYQNTSRRRLDRSNLVGKVRNIKNWKPSPGDGQVVDNYFDIPLDMFQ
jgi:hypothetical protein